MPKTAIPFVGEAYSAPSSSVSSQECINLYPEVAKDGKTVIALYGTPGLVLFGNYGTGPIRLAHVMGGLLYIVSGNELYEVDSAGTGTLKGTVNSLVGDVFADDNGAQLCIVVPGDSEAWVYTVAGGLAKITDEDFVSSSYVTSIDSHFVFSRKSSPQFHISAVGDGASYDALEFATAESDPDNLVAVKKINDQLWLFGDTSIETWHNTGNATFPFEKVIGATLDRGCAAAGSIVRMDNTVFWLGDDSIFYRAETTPVRISTHAIENAVSGYAKVSDATAYSYSHDGHTFYVVTFPTEDITWVFDAATQMWHRRKAFGSGRHAGSKYAHFGRNHVLGDYANGNLYTYSDTTYTDNGTAIVRVRITKPLFSDARRVFMSELQVDFEGGVGLTTGQGSNPQAMLSWSDDGGKSFGTELWTTIGAIGRNETRAVWRRLGQFRQRTFKLEVSDPVKVVISGAYADITVVQ